MQSGAVSTSTYRRLNSRYSRIINMAPVRSAGHPRAGCVMAEWHLGYSPTACCRAPLRSGRCRGRLTPPSAHWCKSQNAEVTNRRTAWPAARCFISWGTPPVRQGPLCRPPPSLPRSACAGRCPPTNQPLTDRPRTSNRLSPAQPQKQGFWVADGRGTSGRPDFFGITSARWSVIRARHSLTGRRCVRSSHAVVTKQHSGVSQSNPHVHERLPSGTPVRPDLPAR